MKRFIMSVVIGLGMTAGVKADISVNFYSSFGVAGPDGVTPLLDTGEQALVQLIYAGSNGVADGPAGLGGTVSGDDVILFSGLTPVATAGDLTHEYGTFSGTDIGGPVDAVGIPGGNVFGRIFDFCPNGNYWLYESPLFSVPNVDLGDAPPPVPTSFDLAPASAGAVADQTLAIPCIPEPSTIGLMGVAGLGLFLSRRKAR